MMFLGVREKVQIFQVIKRLLRLRVFVTFYLSDKKYKRAPKS